MGYTYFNLGALSLGEINMLVMAFNSREKEKQREMNNAKNK